MAHGSERDKWIAVHEWVIGPKLRRFARLAGCSGTEALGILCYLWLWGMDGNADTGGLLLEADLERIKCTFKGVISKRLNSQKVADALVESGWVDSRDGRYYLSDWAEFQAFCDER